MIQENHSHWTPIILWIRPLRVDGPEERRRERLAVKEFGTANGTFPP
jgi:hypothetical protein